jgi:hypothetical protein
MTMPCAQLTFGGAGAGGFFFGALAPLTVSSRAGRTSVSIRRLLNGGYGGREIEREPQIQFLRGDIDLLQAGPQEISLLTTVRDLPLPFHLSAESAETLRSRRLASRCEGFQPTFQAHPSLNRCPQVVPKSRKGV